MGDLVDSNATNSSDYTFVVLADDTNPTRRAVVNASGEVLVSSANETNGTQKTQLIDGAGAIIGPVATFSGVNYLPVSEPLDAMAGPTSVTTQDLASVTTTGFANQSTIIGTPTAGSAASFTTNSSESAMIMVLGIWTGTLSIEVSTNGGTTWVPRGIHVAGTNTFASNITANVVGDINTAAKTNVRVRATAAMTGSASISITTSKNASNVYVANAIKLLDGSSTTSTTTMTIKAASTAPVATDTAIVVALSPNGAQATAALQTTGNTSLANIDSDIDVALSTRSSAANQTNGTQKSQVVDGSGNVQPSGDVAARAIFVKATDGTNTAAVKAASTPAVATDPALVVAISPGSPITVSTKTALTVSSPTAASVGITSAQALASNANRKGLVLTNTSVARISIGVGSAAVLNSGITLYPGGVWVMDDYTFATGAINAIASIATSNLAIQEFTT